MGKKKRTANGGAAFSPLNGNETAPPSPSHLHHQITLLLSIAKLLAQQNSDREISDPLMRRYVGRARDLSRKHLIRWTPSLKAQICRRCNTLVSAPDAVLAIPCSGKQQQGPQNSMVTVQCGCCGLKRNFDSLKYLSYIAESAVDTD